MPNSVHDSVKEKVQSYLERLPDAVSVNVVGDSEEKLLILKIYHHVAAFAFAGADAMASYTTTYKLFKELYRKHQSDWDSLDVAYVLCVSPNAKQLSQLSSRIETDTYFCRKFVIPLGTSVGHSLARLPFLPLAPLEGRSLRPSSAQTFLQHCGVATNLARDIVVQHERSAKGIVDDCLSENYGKPSKLTRAQTLTEIQTDPSTNPIVLGSITVKNFRAYRKKMTFEFGKDITILYGPNGFGKTSLFDAIDFVVTGAIGRLETTSEDRFRKLATHLDSTPKESSISLRFREAASEHTIVRTVEHTKLALLDDVSQERKVILRRLTAGGDDVADRVDNLISLFRATHLFSQESQELAKDFAETCTLSPTIVSRMLAFEDYANAVSKATSVTDLIAGQLDKLSGDENQITLTLQEAHNELNHLRETTKDTKSVGALNSEIEALKAELQKLSMEVPRGTVDAAAIRGWRALLESRLADHTASRGRLAALAKEVATIPALSNEMRDLQSRIDDADARKKSADQRRNTLSQTQQQAQRDLAILSSQLSQAQANLDSLKWLRENKFAYDTLLQAEKSASAELKAAARMVQAESANEARIVAELDSRIATLNASAGQVAAFRADLDARTQLRAVLPRWQSASARMQEVERLIETQQSALVTLQQEEPALRQVVDSHAAEQQRLSHLVENVDRNQSELKQLLSRLQQHVSTGTCPLCGEDHGSRNHLVTRINQQLSRDSASEARASLATLRTRGQALLQQLEANRLAQRTAQQQTKELSIEAAQVRAEIVGYEQRAADLGIATDGSFEDVTKAIDIKRAAISGDLVRASEDNHAATAEVESVRKRSDIIKTAVSRAVAKEASIKQSLDVIQLQLALLRNNPHGANPTLDMSETELAALQTEVTNKIEQFRSIHAANTQQAAQLQQQVESASKEATTAKNEQVPLRSQLTILQQSKAAIVGRLKDASLPDDSTQDELLDHLAAASGRQAQLQTLHGRISSIEIGLDAATTAAALSRLRENIASLEASLANLKANRAVLKPWQLYFTEIKKLVSSEQQEAIDNFTQQYGPRTSTIQRRLRSVYGFDDIKITSRQSEIRVSAERNGEELRPTDYFSQSQQQTLLLGLFLTACSSQNWSSFSPVLLDDPVTHFDDLNTYALLDLILGLLKSDFGRRQFIISTCDEKLLQLARQKFAHLEGGAVYYRFTAISEDGPEVERIQ